MATSPSTVVAPSAILQITVDFLWFSSYTFCTQSTIFGNQKGWNYLKSHNWSTVKIIQDQHQCSLSLIILVCFGQVSERYDRQKMYILIHCIDLIWVIQRFKMTLLAYILEIYIVQKGISSSAWIHRMIVKLVTFHRRVSAGSHLGAAVKLYCRNSRVRTHLVGNSSNCQLLNFSPNCSNKRSSDMCVRLCVIVCCLSITLGLFLGLISPPPPTTTT